MESGFVKIHFPSNKNTTSLILSPLTQCFFLLCSSCDVYLAGFLGDAGGLGGSWGHFVGFSKITNR